tara:strand:- start:624 stop:800 length:177 start_codon:yes stop_codon:yes gene_type:complete
MGVYDLKEFEKLLRENHLLKDYIVNGKHSPSMGNMDLMKQGDLFNGWPEDGEPVKKEP